MKTHAPMEIAALLNQDLQGEHSAILLYLTHAYTLAARFGSDIEAIARDEMRHFDWLARTIVHLGALPDLTPPLIAHVQSLTDVWQTDIRAEEEAIAQYIAHREAIDHPLIPRLLDRIILDERMHKGIFADLAREPVEEGRQEAPSTAVARAASSLQQMVQTEYEKVLGALWHDFVATPQPAAEHFWEARAIESMQHLGTLGEALGEAGQDRPFGHPHVLDKSLRSLIGAFTRQVQATGSMGGGAPDRLQTTFDHIRNTAPYALSLMEQIEAGGRKE